VQLVQFLSLYAFLTLPQTIKNFIHWNFARVYTN